MIIGYFPVLTPTLCKVPRCLVKVHGIRHAIYPCLVTHPVFLRALPDGCPMLGIDKFTIQLSIITPLCISSCSNANLCPLSPCCHEQSYLNLRSTVFALVHLARFGVLGRFHLCEEGLRLRSVF